MKLHALTTLLLTLAIFGCSEPIIISPDAILPDGSVYQGPIVDGKFHGQGTLKYKEGDYYKGHFKNGLFDGLGVYIDSHGSRFEGTFTKGQMKGQFKADYSDDGGTYEGEMADWYFQGQGKYLVDGDTYQGEFKNSEYHGKGKITYQDGSSYEGDFDNGRYHGRGRYTDGDSYYEGDFVDDELNGDGKFLDSEGNQYEGQVESWLPHGNGIYTDTKGNVLKGLFKNGYLNGDGEIQSSDGSHYIGNVTYGNPDGKGVKTNADESVYEGEFSYGQYHGEGKLTSPASEDTDKIVAFGKWQNGKLVHNYATGERHHSQAEVALENHQGLLIGALDAVKQGNPNTTEMYFLGVAGDGSQSVFRREVEYVEGQIQSRYRTHEHSIRLINDHETANRYPLATNRSIELAVNTISEKMDNDQDILFMYLTSHGSKDHEFYLNHDSIKLPPLSAGSLADILAKSEIKWKVIVISACFAGGFIEKLENDNTLIMTAADSSSTSFGCSDESELTYFGKALFEETLSKEPALSLPDAFSQAKAVLEQWEQEQELSPSNPAISAPKAILIKLNKFRESLGDREQ